jgi:hypothetical protein
MSTIDSWWNYSKDYFDILSAAAATTLSQSTFFEISPGNISINSIRALVFNALGEEMPRQIIEETET